MSIEIPGYIVEELRFLVRGGTAENLALVNEIPLVRELVIETDTLKMKVGDGATPWSGLPYFSSGGDGSVQMQATATHIQWRASAEDDWEDLVALDDLRGPAGEDSTVPGPPGPIGGPSGVVINTGPITVDETHKNNWLLQSTGDVTLPIPSAIGFQDGDFVNVRRETGAVGFAAGAGSALDYNTTLYVARIGVLKDVVAAVARGDDWMLIGSLGAA